MSIFLGLTEKITIFTIAGKIIVVEQKFLYQKILLLISNKMSIISSKSEISEKITYIAFYSVFPGRAHKLKFVEKF